MAASVVLDVLFLVDLFFVKDPCEQLSSDIPRTGRAFACQVARTTNFGAFLGILAVTFYALYVVWSYCEYLADGGTSAAIADLLYGKDGMSKTRNETYGEQYGSLRLPGPGGFSSSFRIREYV